jgi:hypothetical protein
VTLDGLSSLSDIKALFARADLSIDITPASEGGEGA